MGKVIPCTFLMKMIARNASRDVQLEIHEEMVAKLVEYRDWPRI